LTTTTPDLRSVDLRHPAAPAPREAPALRRINPFSARITVLLLTLTALGIRLIIVRGFWLDEATQGYDSRLSYGAMLKALGHDNHPPLDYSITWLVAHTLGSTQTDLRLPAILFGTLTIPVLYLAGKALYHERVGVLAAAFGTFGALAVWYSQEARMYSLFMLLATVTIWAQSRILSRDQKRFWLLWAAAGAAMIWTQWFAGLAVGVEILYFVVVLAGRRHDPARRRQLTHLGVAVAGIVVTCAPGIPLLLTQFRNNQATGLGFGSHAAAGSTGGASPYGVFNNLIWALWGYHSNGVVAGVVAIWPLGILAVLLLLGRGRHRSNRLLLSLIVVPMAIVLVASAKAAPSRSLFEIRYFIEAVPALYLLLAGLACNMAASVRARRVFASVLLASLVAGLLLQQTDSHNPRLYGYAAAFKQISSVARPGDEILYAPSYLNVDVRYFEPTMHTAPVTAKVPDLPASARVFVVGSFNFSGAASASTQARQLLQRLERTRHLDEVYQAPNVIVWELS
jgi:uncharacterized membrane protein